MMFVNWILIRYHIFWEIGYSEYFKWKKLRKKLIERKIFELAKEKVKEIIEKNQKKYNPRKAVGYNSIPSKQTILFCIRVAHGLLPWKIVWVMFFNWVLIRYHIFWKIGYFWQFQINKNKKEINWRENALASKGKGKGTDWKNKKKSWPRKVAGYNSVSSKQTTLFCIRVTHGLPS